MKTLATCVLLVLCSLAQAEIMGFASVFEHHLASQPGIIDWAEMRCKVYTSTPATDYLTVQGFTNHCEVVYGGGILFRNYGTQYSPTLSSPGYVELYRRVQEPCLDGGRRYHVELSSFVSLDNGGSYITTDESSTHFGNCYC